MKKEVETAPVVPQTEATEEPAEELVQESEPQPAAVTAPMEPSKVILALQPSSLKLTPEGSREFDKFVDSLRAYPHRPSERCRSARAVSVQQLLVAQGIEEERIQVKGMGNLEPIASNDTREGRSRNRRVEIVVVDDGT